MYCQKIIETKLDNQVCDSTIIVENRAQASIEELTNSGIVKVNKPPNNCGSRLVDSAIYYHKSGGSKIKTKRGLLCVWDLVRVTRQPRLFHHRS